MFLKQAYVTIRAQVKYSNLKFFELIWKAKAP